jgi:hypothetical protein
VTPGTVSVRGAAPAEPLPAAVTAGTAPAAGALRASPRFRLRGAAYKAALTAHILAAAAWFGIAVVVAFCGIAAAVTTSPAPHVFFTMMQTAPWLSIPVGLMAVATGVLLGLGTAHGLIRHWWVVTKIVIAAAVILADALIIGPAAQHAVQSGHASSVLRGATVGHACVLAVAIALAVFKPRARTPWAGAAPSQAARDEPGRPSLPPPAQVREPKTGGTRTSRKDKNR